VHYLTVSDPRWEVIENARPALLAKLAPEGVIRIEVVASFPHSDRFAIWLGTETDEQRNALPERNPCLDEVRSCLAESGFPAEQVSGLLTTAQSQETVDRDYQGSWFYALR
jgi:hypothetical protein